MGSDVFTGSYTFGSRFEEGDGTNREELIGAAPLRIDLEVTVDD